MRILVAHNFYKQPGGEDQCVAAEVALLRAHGHDVAEYYLRNHDVDTMARHTLAARTVWSRAAYRELREVLRREKAQIAHFHNTFPLISPSAYYAARAEGAAVVQTLHNFRLLCPSALLFRQGSVCEACLGKSLPWPGVIHKCYHDSHAASVAIAAMIAAHRALGTWRNAVDVYIALTEFSRRKFIKGGLPSEKIAVKPNFAIPDPGEGTGQGGYAIFVGRLSAEKGIDMLLEAWRQLGTSLPLKILGDGPLAPAVEDAAARDPSIEWLKHVPLARAYSLIGEAMFLVLPSQCYETFARVAMEAFAKGTPVIASDRGAMAAMVDDGRTGLCFKPGDAADLAAKVRRLFADPAERARMRLDARAQFTRNFTADANHERLTSIYARALGSHSGSAQAVAPAQHFHA